MFSINLFCYLLKKIINYRVVDILLYRNEIKITTDNDYDHAHA